MSAEVTNELIFEVLEKIQTNLSDLKTGQVEIHQELQAIRGYQTAMSKDIGNLYGSVGEVKTRLDRIEKRLDLVQA